MGFRIQPTCPRATRSILVASMSLVAVVAFVIASPAEAQKNSAEAPDTENALYDLSKVSFLGIHTVQLPGDDQRPESLDSYGQFTIQGPRVETMRPILAKNGGVAKHSNGDLFLYGEYGEAHVDLTSKTWTRLDKQSVGRQPHGGTTTAMALDTRRNCLLISRDNHLYAYDPQAKRWLWRKEHKAPFLGLAYDPNRDLFYGVVGENLDPRERFLRERMMGNPAVGGREFAINSPLKIRHITPEGESHVEVTVQKPLPPKPIAYNFQTTFSQGVLILFTDHSLFAIDPMNGAVVYRGETTLHRNGNIWSDGTTAPHMPSIGERRDRLQERLKAVTPRLDKVRAASLKAELNCLTQCMRGDCVMERIAGKAEVHAVGMYTVHEPSMNGELICPVTVSHTAAPIILVLSAHETLTWKIKANPTVRIEQVVLAGWNKQDVEGVPENTPVIDRTGKTHPEHYLYAAPTGRTAGARDGFGGSVHAVFGAEPMTMQFQYNGPSYQIGGESDAWSSQYIESLARNLERDLFVAENEDLAFTAIFRHGKPSNRQSLLT